MARYLIAEEGPLKGLVIDLEEGTEWIIGNDPDKCDYTLEDPTIAGEQLRLEKTDDGIVVVNVDLDNPVTVGDAPIYDPHLLHDGDHVVIGQNHFRFTEEIDTDTHPKTTESYDTIFEDVEESPLIDSSDDTLDEELDEKNQTPEEFDEKVPFERTVYDTIFEDSSDYEELPFHLLGESPLILKVISGPNAGAEIGLQKNKEYTIGKDSNTCDIVFQDVSVSRNHAKLSISAQSELTIEDLGSKNGTLVNNIPIDKPQKITGQDLVQLGTTTFLIIDREAIAETIYAPSVETEEDEEPVEEITAKVSWKERIIPMRHLVLAGSTLVVLFIMFMSFFSLFKSEKATLASKEESGQIEEVMTYFPKVTYTYNPASGKLFLTGHVLTSVDLEKLSYELNQLPFVTSVDDNVVIDEYITKSTNDVLIEHTNFKGVSLTSPSPGSFVLTGYLDTSDHKEALVDFMQMNFPYLDLLQDDVVVEQNLQQQISSMLIEKGFPAVTFQLNNGDLVLSGRYNTKRSRFYDELLDHFKYLKGIRSVQNFALPSSAASASIDMTKKYNVTGYAMTDHKNYGVVINGKIFLRGQSLDGMKITDIAKDMVLLEKDGIHYKINYSRQ
jgi:type III secretion system YscD/HrpQ family protein